MGLFWNQCKWMMLVIAIVCVFFKSGVDGNEELATKYTNIITNILTLVTHPYRNNTAVMSGSRGVAYVSMNPISNSDSSVELILTRRALSFLGYRIHQNDHRVVFLFSDSDSSALDEDDYDQQEQLPFGGSYEELTKSANKTLEEVLVNAQTLKTGILKLENGADQSNILWELYVYAKNQVQKLLVQAIATENSEKQDEQQRAEILLSLAIIFSEGARFTEIQTSVQQALATSETWHASSRHVSLMNSWSDLSTFIANNPKDVKGTTKQYFSKLNQTLTLKEALDITAVIQRSFQTPRQLRLKAQNRSISGIDVAIPDGPNHVWLFNGPNFAYVHYTPGANNDSIVGGVKSIFMEWPLVQGTDFVNGFDAAIRLPKSSYVYVFKGELYATLNLSKKRIGNRYEIQTSWPSLNETIFINGIDTGFHSYLKDEVYMFLNDQFVHVHYKQMTYEDYIMEGPSSISDHWPTWHDTIFENGFDCAFDRPGLPEVYLFKSNQFMYDSNYTAEGNDVKHLTISTMIQDGWMSLKNTAFDI